jgi:hypothetical protein
LDFIDDTFPFTKEDLILKLPKILPCSIYHGDMTLENIIYNSTRGFYFIDPVTVPYDSWVFDIAKLRQDLECGWFLRDNDVDVGSDIMLDIKTKKIQKNILKKFPIADNKYLLILMLLRVYRHCEINSKDYVFIMREINHLWT